jgi:hypothetical protein
VIEIKLHVTFLKIGNILSEEIHQFILMSPWKAYYWIRNSQRRITVKTKNENIDSSIVVKTGKREDFFNELSSIFICYPWYMRSVHQHLE